MRRTSVGAVEGSLVEERRSPRLVFSRFGPLAVGAEEIVSKNFAFLLQTGSLLTNWPGPEQCRTTID